MENPFIIVTGAAGFIGSCLTEGLNRSGFNNLVLVDDFSRSDKLPNWSQKRFKESVDRKIFPQWLKEHASETGFVFHLGARTDTTEFNVEVFNTLNLNYSKEIWNICTENHVPLVYASSAATYGSGELGYSDDHHLIPELKPLNPYGESKNEFDKWVLKQQKTPPFWTGLKFFNVYGPNEYHKGRMASVVFHAFRQIQQTGQVKLFRSHRPDYEDGKQLRDFIYVKDVVNVMLFLLEKKSPSGIYNLGTGKARSFLDLAKAVFSAMQIPEKIQFIDTPEDIRNTYQYFTQAQMDKLRQAGYTPDFTSLETGVFEYVSHYLLNNTHL